MTLTADINWKAAIRGDIGAKYSLIESATNMTLLDEYRDDVYRWCCELAEAGDPRAQYHWAIIQGFQHDFESPDVLKWFIASAEKKYPPALSYLGELHLDGSVVDKNILKAFNCFQEAARMGDPRGQANLACFYADGVIVKKDERAAVQLLELSADKNIRWAWHRLGHIHEQQNTLLAQSEAIRCYLKGAREGDNKCMIALGRYYEKQGGDNNYSRAVAWYRRAVPKVGLTVSNCRDNLFSLQDVLVFIRAADLNKAMKSAEQDKPAAQVVSGLLMYKDDAAEWADENQRAYDCFLLAAEQGYALGQYCLACIMEIMSGCEDASETFKWLVKAADQGLAEAQLALGRILRKYGDKDEAIGWYILAAEQDCIQAQVALGEMLSSGECVERNMAEAAMWFRKACEWSFKSWFDRLWSILDWEQR